MRGELDFEAALIARVALLKGLPASVLERCYAERVRLNPGARTLVRTMAALGAETALVSGGFTFFSERVARGGRLRAAPGQPAARGRRGADRRGRRGRSSGARRSSPRCAAIAAEAGIGPEAALAVGDGANDADMVEAAGLGVAYHAKPALAAVADARLEHSDLTALLALQGIPEASGGTRRLPANGA